MTGPRLKGNKSVLRKKPIGFPHYLGRVKRGAKIHEITVYPKYKQTKCGYSFNHDIIDGYKVDDSSPRYRVSCKLCNNLIYSLKGMPRKPVVWSCNFK